MHHKRSSLLFLVFILFVACPCSAQQPLRVVSYNIQDKPTSGSESADLRTIIGAIGDTAVLGYTGPIDVFAFQEGPRTTSSYNFVENDFEAMFGGNYEYFYADDDSSGDRTGVVYNASRLILLSAQSVDDQGFTHPPTVATFRPVLGTVEDEFTVVSIHLKAGSSNADLARRADETAAIQQIVDDLSVGAQVIVLGDFNMRGSNELAWDNFVNAGLVETLNAPFGIRPTNWNENLAFHPFHTQECTGAIGGMDDRYDVQITSVTCQDGLGFELVPGSLSVLGNNGTHTLNGSIATGNGAPNIQNELMGFSDHLPVFADFRFGVNQPVLANQLHDEAIANYTVTPNGPRTGNSGTSFVNVEGDGNGNFASFAVIDFDLTDVVVGQQMANLIQNPGLDFRQSNASFSRNGPISLYLASSSATDVPINASVQYQTGNNGIDCLPVSLADGAVKLAIYPAVHIDDNGNRLPNGSLESIALYSQSIQDAIRDRINQNGVLRILAVPEQDDTAATYAGITNSTWNGPVLFADFSVPVTVVAESFAVTRGILFNGGLPELMDSDNADLAINRNPADVQGRIEVEFESTSPTSAAHRLEFRVEAAVFARSPVEQNVQLWNYDNSEWELVDSRNASRFSDSVVDVIITENAQRFIEPGTNKVRARTEFRSIAPRQKFSANLDLVRWTIE